MGSFKHKGKNKIGKFIPANIRRRYDDKNSLGCADKRQKYGPSDMTKIKCANNKKSEYRKPSLVKMPWENEI